MARGTPRRKTKVEALDQVQPVQPATVEIVLEVAPENVLDFIGEWDNLVSNLISLAGVKSAVMTIPEGIRRIELSTF
jgi:hypothetical protein